MNQFGHFISKIKIGTKLLIGSGVLLLLLIIVGAVVTINTLDMEDQFEFVVTHDAVVIANAHQLIKLIVDMETGQRGFVITHKEDFLDPYYNGYVEFKKLMAIEKTLVYDDPAQVLRLKGIEQLVEQWQMEAAIPEIKLAQKVSQHDIDAEYLQIVLGKGLGKGLMDNLRSILEELNYNLEREGNLKAVCRRMNPDRFRLIAKIHIS